MRNRTIKKSFYLSEEENRLQKKMEEIPEDTSSEIISERELLKNRKRKREKEKDKDNSKDSS